MMASKTPLMYWLESMSLSQYLPNFQEFGLTSQAACLQLDDDLLVNIGISMPGHRKRILSHLPTDDLVPFWTDTPEEPPILPPKQKSFRDSFIFQEEQNKSVDGADSLYGNLSLSLNPSPQPTPRPVPKPRVTKTRNSPSTELKKPVPAKRSTPNKAVVPNVNSDTTADKNTADVTDDTNNAVESPSDTVLSLRGACLSESYSDSADKHSLNKLDDTKNIHDDLTPNLPSDLELYVNSDQFANCDSREMDNNVSRVAQSKDTEGDEDYYINFPTDNHKGNGEDSYINIPSDKHADYINLDTEKDAKSAKCVSPKKHCRTNKRSEKHGVDKDVKAEVELFENAEYDFSLKTYKSALETKERDVLENAVAQELYADSGFNDFAARRIHTDSPSEAVGATAGAAAGATADVDDSLYEAIWTDKKDNSPNTKAVVRDSSLMQFSPPRPKSAQADSRESYRDSFNLPMPSFAPPPLPTDVKKVGDLLSDFDPLADAQTETQTSVNPLPILPPRPGLVPSVPTRFETFSNFNFPLTTESPTLPLSENREPEMDMNTPKSIPSQDAIYSLSADPFENEDPFQEFTPQCEDFNVGVSVSADTSSVFIPPPTSHSKTQPENKMFVTVPDSHESEPIYAEADDDIDVEPVAARQKPSVTILPRSISNASSSSNSSHRLSAVVPPPSLCELPADEEALYGNLDPHEATYSFSKDLGECDSDSTESLDMLIDEPDHSDPHSNMTPVEILPTASLSPRRKERFGYLYKQGGVKQNRGWRKRWVVFDGKSIRYYSNSQNQVSKRIVPLSSMANVEMDVKPSNSKQFKFKLHCHNRVFLFATDSLDDCKMWSSTLMEAILTYTKPTGGEVDGGDMHDPDIASWIKFDRKRYKFYVALKKHKFCYYQNMDDFKMASPLHEIDLKLAAVKEIDRTRLQLSTHYSHFILHFESSSDASNWKMAIEEAITDALGDNSVLEQVKENPSNGQCADCGCKEAHWASMNLGIVLCVKCAGIHRGFDRGLSKIRSLRMDTKVWNSSLIEMFKVIGNTNANLFWLRRLPPDAAISEKVANNERKTHIYNKYKDKLYCDKHSLAGDQQQLNEALLLAAQEDDVLLTMQILLSGAEVLYHRTGEPDTTAFELAKQSHQRIQMEFLLQNGGDRTKNFMPGSEEASLVAKLRAEVQHQGYMQKTGSNMKDFLKRWCVLEHGHLSYFVSEESKVEKDRIESDNILTIQTTSHDKQPYCLELSTKKSNRLYLFAASSADDRLHWMQSIAQVFCPVSLMDRTKCKNFTVAGYSYMKMGLNQEWQKTWFILEDRRLYFTDKCQHELEEDSVDLRRATSITKITQGLTDCDACLEVGPQFVINIPDKALYFQADLARDTDKMFNILETAVKRGGDVLEDQVLGTDDVPVIISQCIHFIEQNGIMMSGIYREAAQNSKVQNLVDAFHKDARSVVLKMEDHTVHEVCNVLKRFLRNLADPLFTAHLYSRWIQTAGESDHNMKLQWYKYLLNQLPHINKLTIKALAQHLKKLTQHQKVNKMTLDNISIAFGSSLMKSDKVDALMPTQSSIGNMMQLEMKVISDIVSYHEWLFDIEEAETEKEDRIKEALRKLEQIGRNSVASLEDLNISVHYQDPKGVAESVKINQSSTVEDVVKAMRQRLNLASRQWCLHEIVKGELERPLHPSMKVMPLVLEWQKWAPDYRSGALLCLKSSELCDKIEKAFVQGKPLFAEMKYGEKKKAAKMAFEFTQSKLSFYRDVKNVSNPAGSWNVEDLRIYKGSDSKRQNPTKWAFSFLTNTDRVGEKELPYFGRAVFFSSESEMLCWMSAMMNAQHPSGFS